MFRFILKEASLMAAFIVLGGILLLCLWVTNHLNENILKEFKDTQISVILKNDSEASFKQWIEKAPDVIRFQIFGALENKDRLAKVYPELKNLVSPLDEKFFPPSALITVSKPQAFLRALGGMSDVVETQMLHEPPRQLRRFVEVLTVIFSALWLLTLALVLYFHLERLAVTESQKWSLMKVLGSKTFPVFRPLWAGQLIRVSVASLLAIFMAVFATRQIQNFFIWDWVLLPSSVWVSFFLTSITLTTLISFSLFYIRYRQVPLG
jgi:hypothetical protein